MINPNNLAFLSFILSLIYSVYKVLSSFDFVEEIYIYTGAFALIFLNLSLFFSLFKFTKTKKYPKLFGFFAVFFSLIHFLNYFIFDRNLNLLRVINDVSSRLFESSGFVAFVLLLLMFVSSFKSFKSLSFIRKFAYLCLLIASYHFFLSAKSPNVLEYLALTFALLWISVAIFKKIQPFFAKKTKAH